MKDINLLPEEFEFGEKRKEVKRKKIPMNAILITMLVVLFLAASFATPFIVLRQKEIRLESIKDAIESAKFAEVTNLEEEVAKLEKKIQVKDDIVRHIDNKYYSIGDVLTVIKNASPSDGFVIQDMQYNGQTVQISGKAVNNTIAMNFFANVEAQSKFHGLEKFSGPAGSSYGIYDFTFTFDVGTRKGGR